MSPAAAAAAHGERRPLVAIVGNPNTGKTALFNQLTGENARVGNYPGITVERRVATLEMPGSATPEADLLDVPGAYSLSARSGEEQVAIDALLGLRGNPRPDLVVIVLDATQVVRNLYLALQVLELGLPAVIALNMIDEAGPEPPDHRSIAAALGVPCVPTSARTGQGIADLRRAVARALGSGAATGIAVEYAPALLRDAAAVAERLPDSWRRTGAKERALALWALSSIDAEDELAGIDGGLRDRVAEVHAAAAAAGRDLDLEVIAPRYAFLDAQAHGFHRPPPPRTLTERVDRVLLHPVWGFAVFVALMLGVFQALFWGADPLIGLVEDAVGALGALAARVLPAGVATDLVVDGIIGGVGNVVVFLPQILLLFLFIGLLEDSGYMARAAFLMDRVMRALGLHGRAFVPMLSGFACAVPAIMATRTMERERDRVLTMLVVPLMTCSARLPVYTLVIAAMFPPSRAFGWLPVQGLLMMSMYIFGLLIALVAAGVLGRTVLRGRRVPLILELPPYRLPTARSTVRLMWERGRAFLSEAGTVILVCTVAMWALLSFPRLPEPPGGGDAAWEAAQLEQSYAGRVGKAIEPVIAPLGFDWRVGVGIIGSFAAREVFVSTMGVVYGVGGDVDEESAPLRDRMRAETRADGRPAYSPAVGLSLLVFFALAMQCMSTLAIVRRETRGWKWPVALFAYMTVLAWVGSFVVYQAARRL